MPRLLVHVEGQTEETFVRDVLAPHLYGIGFQYVAARLIGNARQRDRRGGIQGWPPVRQGILNHLKQDQGWVITTMVDYYALPAGGVGAWPGRSCPPNLTSEEKSRRLTLALRADLELAFGGFGGRVRFIPYVMMYEFEGLLFSNCERFARGIHRPNLRDQLQAIRDQFPTPEDINDSPVTAPSKRIEALVPGYQKPLHGVSAASSIGLTEIRAQCPQFSRWVAEIEALVG